MRYKIIGIILFAAFLSAPLYAGQHRSVPIGHRAYSVIQSAQLRGLADSRVSAKPYSASYVISVLEKMQNNPQHLRDGELEIIADLIQELTFTYETEDMLHLLRQGSYRSYNEQLGIGIALGAAFDGQYSQSLLHQNHYDVRYSMRPYFRGDILDFASLYMDFGIRYDKLDSRVFHDTEFSIPGEGFYMKIRTGGSMMNTIPEHPELRGFHLGLDFFPEISFSFLSGALEFRFANIHRDWGVGHNNIQLSGTARPFDGIEGHLKLSDWFRYSFVTGALGIFSLNTLDGEPFFSDYINRRKDYRFSTNYSAKRAEVDLPFNFTYGIFEACVWQKRFEIGYLNPFGILMFQQNLQADVDNMLAGMDLQWHLPGTLRLHGTWAITEMNVLSLDRFLTAPRNIMAYQGGADVHLPFGLFSMLAVQYTRLDPFFYTHYAHEAEFLHLIYRNDENVLETAYVNKGENLGYPLHPNSDELLVKAHIGLGSGWDSLLTFKYQRRSGQYGYRIDMPVPLGYEDIDGFDDKDFGAFVFERTVSAEAKISKQFTRFPLRVFGTYQFLRTVDRDRLTTDEEKNHHYAETWNNPTYNHFFRIGFSIYK